MFGFMTYIEKDGGVIGGYLLTNRELSPVQFGHTSKISLPSKLEKDTSWSPARGKMVRRSDCGYVV